MIKKTILFSALVILLLTLPSFAAGHVRDDAGLFDNVELLEQKLTELEEILGYPSYIYTTNQPFAEDAQTATNLLLMDKVGKNQNGTIFTINMATRDYQFSTSGPDLQIDKLSDADIKKMIDGLGKCLKNGDFDGAGIFYCKQLRLSLDDNYISTSETTADTSVATIFNTSFAKIINNIEEILHIAFYALILAFGYNSDVFTGYEYSPKPKPYLYSENVDVDYAPKVKELIDTIETVTVVKTETHSTVSSSPDTDSSFDRSSSYGSSSYSSRSGGGDFRGGGGKF